MVDCPHCENEIETVIRKGENTFHHGGDGDGCGYKLKADFVDSHADEFELIDDFADDEADKEVSDEQSSQSTDNTMSEQATSTPNSQPPRGAIPDDYTARVQEKAERVVKWIQSGPVGVNPESENASDFIDLILKKPDVTDEPRTLSTWIDQYFPQVREPSVDSLYDDLQAIDQYHESGGAPGGYETPEDGQSDQPPQDSGDGVTRDEMMEMMKMMQESNQRQAKQQQQKEAGNEALTEAREKVVVELGEEFADSFGLVKNFAREVLMQEVRENPEFRKQILNQFGPDFLLRSAQWAGNQNAGSGGQEGSQGGGMGGGMGAMFGASGGSAGNNSPSASPSRGSSSGAVNDPNDQIREAASEVKSNMSSDNSNTSDEDVPDSYEFNPQESGSSPDEQSSDSPDENWGDPSGVDSDPLTASPSDNKTENVQSDTTDEPSQSSGDEEAVDDIPDAWK